MNPILQTKLENLPPNSGVYQFLNEKGIVIYVGKAKNLRSRVKNYFHTGIGSPKTIALVNKIHNLELIVTDNEIEALVLENNLIKQHQPRYNILLKDDKSFPFIKVTNELFPRIYPTRRLVRDGSRYFGPYTDVKNMKASLRTINQIFRIRSCKLNLTEENISKKKFKVCLDYHIKKCDGPCEGFFTTSQYQEMVKEVVKLLNGKSGELIKSWKIKMQQLSADLQFEAAAEYRDKISKLESISEKQKVVTEVDKDRDIITAAFEGKDASCSIFIIRSGKLIGKKQLRLTVQSTDSLAEIYNSIIKLYYTEYVELPDELVIEEEPEDAEILTEWLTKKFGKKVVITIPKRGDLLSLVKMCKENAILQLKELQLQRMKKEGNVPFTLNSLKRDLRLTKLPMRIECFDISNLQGTDSVASMVVFIEGKAKKSEYRKFIIKSVDGPDDFASMHEVITRRYKRLLEENKPFPEMIMVDGGKGQLSSAVDALEKLEVKHYEIIGLAKKLEEIFIPSDSEPIIIPRTSSSLKLLQMIRDEAHRFAITFHRQRRSKRIIATELEEIKGIGNTLSKKLLKSFGSLYNIKAAGLEELSGVIGEKKAKLIVTYFEQKSA